MGVVRVDGLGISELPPRRPGPLPGDLPLEVAALQVLAAGEDAGQEVETDDLVAQGLGAVVFFASALRDPDRAASRSAALQAAALRGPAVSPLLLAADEEGGRVCRLPLSPATMPGAMALAAAGGGADLARTAGRATAGRLAAVGVNWNLAPVCDLWAAENPALGSRCFARAPALAAELAAAFAQGLRDGGVAACAKHFPGHGATAVDSHEALPVLDADLALLRRREWLPFAAAVRAGVETVMTGHLLAPALGPEPASLSSTVTRALREELGFTGVVVTDALGMSGCLRYAGDVGRAAVLALHAGADVALVGHGPAEQRQARDALAAAVRAGRLARERLDQAVGRVWALKEALGLARKGAPQPAAASHLLARPADVDLARWIALRSITELAPGPRCARPATIRAGEGAAPALLAAVRARWPQAREEPPSRDAPPRCVTLDARCHLLVGLPVPPALPEGAVLLAYDATPASLAALLACATGEAEAGGRLPL